MAAFFCALKNINIYIIRVRARAIKISTTTTSFIFICIDSYYVRYSSVIRLYTESYKKTPKMAVFIRLVSFRNTFEVRPYYIRIACLDLISVGVLYAYKSVIRSYYVRIRINRSPNPRPELSAAAHSATQTTCCRAGRRSSSGVHPPRPASAGRCTLRCSARQPSCRHTPSSACRQPA